MSYKYWSRDNGKSIYYGPEEDFLEHCKRDPDCVEVPEDRPTPWHNWNEKQRSYVEDQGIKDYYLKLKAKDDLEKLNPYYFIELNDPEENLQKKIYLKDLSEFVVGKNTTLPEKPKFMLQ